MTNDKIKVAYQLEENGYHGRSFEEAFININIVELTSNVDSLTGISGDAEEILKSDKTIDDKTDEILDKKNRILHHLCFGTH